MERLEQLQRLLSRKWNARSGFQNWLCNNVSHRFTAGRYFSVLEQSFVAFLLIPRPTSRRTTHYIGSDDHVPET